MDTERIDTDQRLKRRRRLRFLMGVERLRGSALRKFERIITDAVRQQLKPIIPHIIQRMQINEQMVDTMDNGILMGAMQVAYRTTGEMFAVGAWSRLTTGKRRMSRLEIKETGKDFPRGAFGDRMDAYVATDLAELIVEMDETTKAMLIRRIRPIVQRGIDAGIGARQIGVLISKEIGQIALSRGMRIARTELLRASNIASMAGAELTGLDVMKIWNTSIDEVTRAGESGWDHIAADGEEVKQGQDFMLTGEPLSYPNDPKGSPGNTINCFTGDTLVSFDSCKKAIRSIYNGEIITIETAGGNKLTGTPNHPIMTPSGFIRLDELKHGMDVICCPLDSYIFKEHFDVDNIPISFEKFYYACAIVGMIMGVRSIAVNLYGRIPDSDIEVINMNGFLRSTLIPKLFKPFNKNLLKIAYFGKRSFFRFRLFYGNFFEKFSRFISYRIMCSFGNCFSFLFGRILKADNIRLSTISDGNVIILKNPVNDCPADAEFTRDCKSRDISVIHSDDRIIKSINTSYPKLNAGKTKHLVSIRSTDAKMNGNFFNRFSSAVHIDRISSIKVSQAHNVFVYTLETKEQIYNSGGIITSNCRCTVDFRAVE